MEQVPTFLVMFNVCAISHPRVAAGFGLLWIAARVAYQVGYGKHGPKGRSRGSHIGYAANIGLVCPPCCWS